VTKLDTFIENLGNALVIDDFLDDLGQTLAERCLILDDGDPLAREMLDKIGGGDRTLLVITACRAERVPQPAVGEGRIGRSWRDLDDTVLGIDIGCGDRHARIDMADNPFDAIGNEFVGDRDACFRIGHIVADLDRKLLTGGPASGIEIFDRHVSAALELLTPRCARARERCGNADLDSSIVCRGRYGKAKANCG
jgi:hypothetical protein